MPGRPMSGVRDGSEENMTRIGALQSFLDAAFVAFDRFALDGRSMKSLQEIFALLKTPSAQFGGPGHRLAACDFLDAALKASENTPLLQNMGRLFVEIEPRIRWTSKANADSSASANFANDHANAMIIGPGGIEERTDVWLGATLMAPHTRYPDHTHPPEETYLCFTAGEFMQEGNPWFSPGVAGSFYNPPEILHAMRSVDEPFLAFWALRIEEKSH